ncbi:MAG TPA: alpha/beta fold hydrolase [Verrucomicrobiae bacterium]|nr:alpha/beta fold hydrolase [Verrucomicrobiae bacterium]
MAVLSELRYPTTRIAKVLSAFLALALFAVVSVATISGFLLYQILRPPRSPVTFDLNVMMGQPSDFGFSVPDGPDRTGLFFPGLRGAPTIVICHGYMSQRADLLTLASALQDHEYNVFLFDFAGHGSTPGLTSLGYKETGELSAALQALAGRNDVDPKHFGLWGVDMGGYVALEVATSDPRVAAFAVDNAYADPKQMLNLQVAHSGLSIVPYVVQLTDFGFRMLNYQFRNEPPVTGKLIHTKGVPKLFILSDERPGLAQYSLDLFLRAPEPKQMQRDRLSYSDMTDEDRHAYENQIVTFFLQNMPASAAP